jgi:hypothetical protein
METTKRRKCFACGEKFSSFSSIDSKYCYRHYQIFDSFIAEHKAVVKAYGSISWKDFLIKKLSDAGNNIDPDLKKVIQAELKNT